jgi:hypothetical protein
MLPERLAYAPETNVFGPLFCRPYSRFLRLALARDQALLWRDSPSVKASPVARLCLRAPALAMTSADVITAPGFESLPSDYTI